MENCSRQLPPLAAPEKVALDAFLDYHRATLLCKVDGLSDEDLRKPGTPSGVTLLGMVKHLAYAERWWFGAVFRGETLEFPWSEKDPDADWRVEPGETTDEILALYRRETQRSRDLVQDAEPDDVALGSAGDLSGFDLRSIMLHMIEETARHNGHADIIREAIDGMTGE